VPPGPDPTAGFGHRTVHPLEYALTQPGVIFHYLRLAIWPHPLVIDYAWPKAESVGAIVPPAIGLCMLLGLTVWAIIRRPGLGFLGAWIFGLLAPSSSIIPVSDFAFEHRAYLPLAGILTLLVLGARRILDRLTPSRPRVGRASSIALLVAVAAGAGALTVRRNSEYGDQLGMWTATVKQRPLSARAHINVGYFLAQRGDFLPALPHAVEGIRLCPDDKIGRLNLGYILAHLGRYDEAMQHFLAVLERHPNDPEAYNNLGLTMVRLGRIDEAIAYYRKAIEANPYHPGVYNNLGRVYQQLGRFEEAVASYRKALELEPGLVAAQKNDR
jgi:tetratricopeptide (TPR) repeat protein